MEYTLKSGEYADLSAAYVHERICLSFYLLIEKASPSLGRSPVGDASLAYYVHETFY